MLTPFVARLAQITNSQNHQFTIPHVDRRLSQNMVCKYHPAFGQLRMVRQRLKDIERTSLVDIRVASGSEPPATIDLLPARVFLDPVNLMSFLFVCAAFAVIYPPIEHTACA